MQIYLKFFNFPFILAASKSSSKSGSPSLSVSSSSSAKRLVHHNFDKDDTTEALYTALPAQDFKWSLAGASWITETQTYYLIGNDGSFGLIQMGYSNITYRLLVVVPF